METFKDLSVLLFETRDTWHDWLDANHQQPQAVWIKFAKKSSDKTSITYTEAIEEALCYGWIDGQVQAYDADYWLQKFVRRGAKSVWSKINVARVESLIKEDRMQPAGLAAVELAKKSGAWQMAYDPPSNSTVPEDFQAALDQNPKAKAFYATLNKANTYAFCWRIQTAKKPETRKARIEKFIDMLNKGEKFH